MQVARQFVAARQTATALPAYPGSLPASLDAAYARQDAAIALWPDAIVGWKVGKIPDAWCDRLGEERLVGPIFRQNVQRLSPGDRGLLRVIPGGFAAVEAEYIFEIAVDVDPAQRHFSLDDACTLAACMRLGIEFAGSPLASINELGPAVVVSDFGNNAGLLVGPKVDDWQQSWPSLFCETFIGGRSVGRGGATSISGGPLAALIFALERNARRGRPLRRGDLVSTGASTGIHDIRIGERARVEFTGGTVLHCEARSA